MRLRTDLPALEQIASAVEAGVQLCFDLRKEKMGDKAAFIGIARWIHSHTGTAIALVESREGFTPFMLSDYELPEGLYAREAGLADELSYLDCHTLGLMNDAAWILSHYCARKEFRPKLQLKTPKKELADVVFAFLPEVDYNARRSMNEECAFQMIQQLSAQYKVSTLCDKPQTYFDVTSVPLNEAIEIIAGAKVFIGGDTGFTHVARAMGVPTVALYPDWHRYGKFSMSAVNAIADWWDIDCRTMVGSYLPANTHELRVAEIDTNHNWAIDLVTKYVGELMK